MMEIISPISAKPIKIVRLDMLRDEFLFRRTIDFLVENLPFDSMKQTARMILSNEQNISRTISCLDREDIVGGVFGGPLTQETSYLQFLWILSTYRKIGLGKELLRTFEDAQREYGARFVEADTYEKQNRDWMEHMGYSISSETFDKGRKMWSHRKTLSQ